MFVAETRNFNWESKTVALGLMEVSCSKEWHKNRNLRKVRDPRTSLWLKSIIKYLIYFDIVKKLSSKLQQVVYICFVSKFNIVLILWMTNGLFYSHRISSHHFVTRNILPFKILKTYHGYFRKLNFGGQKRATLLHSFS